MFVFICECCETAQSRLFGEDVDVDLGVEVVIEGTGFCFSKPSVLPQHGGVALLRIDVAIRVHELAPFPERADPLFVVGEAGSGQVIFRNMILLLKFIVAVGIRALNTPAARTFGLPVPAHLSLLLIHVRTARI